MSEIIAGPEDGFTLVELLVALAVASALLVAIGEFYFSAATLGQRQHEQEAAVEALDRLLVVRAALSDFVARTKTRAELQENGHINLFYQNADQSTIDLAEIVPLIGSNNEFIGLSFSSDRGQTDVVLPAHFDGKLELVANDQSEWIAASELTPQPVRAVRLAATISGFPSPIVLWSSSGF